MNDKTADAERSPTETIEVDDEPALDNQRDFAGWRMGLIASMAAVYAAFHVAALNGLSLSALTGIEVPFLPRFPMETWNFRIVHVAGALFVGFLLYSASTRFATHHAGCDRRTGSHSG